MSRSYGSKSWLSGCKRWYKPQRASKERAKVRMALEDYKQQPVFDQVDMLDFCGIEGCTICGTILAPEAGPTIELEPWNAWEYD